MAFKKSLAAFVFALPFVVASPVKRQIISISTECAFLEPIKNDLLENLFNNECGDTAHGALRLSFHDAIGISPTLGGGGADGSIIIFNETELQDPGNVGIDDILAEISPFFFNHSNAITPGDFIQFAGALSLTVCPGAPRVKYFIGRPQPKAPAPDFIIPRPINTTDQLLSAFADAGFNGSELVALLASHSAAGVDDFAPPLRGIPLDSTPAVFDTNFFLDVLLNGTLFPPNAIRGPIVGTAINGTIRLLSDFELARDPRTACTWQSFALNQTLMVDSFAQAFFKMSLLGQSKNKNLIDCSAVIPTPPALNGSTIVFNLPEFPPQEFLRDVDQSCAAVPFPNISTAPGPALDVPPYVDF